MTPLESELGWAAGIVDADGTIRIAKNRQRYGVKVYSTYEVYIDVHTTTTTVLDRFEEIVGTGGHRYEHKRHRERYKTNRRAWSLRYCGAAGERVLKLLQPYFWLKKERCEVALAARELVSKRGVKNPHRQRLERLHEIMKYLNRTGIPWGDRATLRGDLRGAPMGQRGRRAPLDTGPVVREAEMRRLAILAAMLALLIPTSGYADALRVGVHIASATTTTLVAAVAAKQVQVNAGSVCVDGTGVATNVTLQSTAGTNIIGTSVVYALNPGQCLFLPRTGNATVPYYNPTAAGTGLQVVTSAAGPVNVYLEVVQQ